MNQQELRNDFTKLCMRPTLTEQKQVLQMFSTFLGSVIYNHHHEDLTSEAIGHAKLLVQMMLSKTLHLSSLVDGVAFSDAASKPFNNLIDPTITAISIRNVFETVGAFNLIYRQPISEDERTIMHLMWVIAGLKYRQRFESNIISAEVRQKQEQEQLKIQSLITQIKQTDLYRGLPGRSQEKINTRIKQKEYLIRFSGTDIEFLAWHDLIQVMGVRPRIFDNIYTYFSLYAHPSNVSVFQFGQMFDEVQKANVDLANLNLTLAITLLSIFAADYIAIFPKVLKTFDALPLLQQIVLDFHNRFARGNDYAINQSWQALNDLQAYQESNVNNIK